MKEKTIRKNWNLLLVLMISALMFVAIPVAAGAQEFKTFEDVKKHNQETLVGKKILFVPHLLAVPIQQIAAHYMRIYAEDRGLQFEVKDCNGNNAVMTQIVTAAITERPDVMVIQSVSPTMFNKLFKQCEQAGIHVIQIWENALLPTSAYVGPNSFRGGEMIGEDICKECGAGSGKSGKIAIVVGDFNKPVDRDLVAGVKSKTDKDKAIQLVSTQACQIDPQKATEICQTLLKQHPDLCAIFGTYMAWGTGGAQFIKASGMDTKMYVLSGGELQTYDYLKEGLFYKTINHPVKECALQVIDTASDLIQSGEKPGKMRWINYVRWQLIGKENLSISDFEKPPEKM